MTCNVGGTHGNSVSTLNVKSGATLTFEWHQHEQRTGEPPLSPGHKGPILVYIARAPGNVSFFSGEGAVWTKIYESGLRKHLGAGCPYRLN